MNIRRLCVLEDTDKKIQVNKLLEKVLHIYTPRNKR